MINEPSDVDIALHAADTGRAGHWPTVAGVLADEVRRLRVVEEKAQAYVMAGLYGNPDTRTELRELIEVARTDR